MGKSTPSPPPAPDPTVVAAAQSKANIDSATAQQKLNMINTSGPTGSVSYAPDPTAPGGYSQTTALSPGQQGIYDQGVHAQNQALGVANDQIGRVGQALGQTLDLSTLPHLTTGVSAGPVQHSFDPGQAVQGSLGQTDFSGAVKAAADASYGQATSRLDPQWNLKQHQMETDLANQGLGENSTAYQNAQKMFGQQENDAYNQAGFAAQQQGLAAQQQGFGQALNSGQFANAAAGQEYAQNQGMAAFGNQATAQDLQQQIAAGTFGNQARGQDLQEQAYVQNQPLNQFNSLMSSSQVASPQGIQYTPSQVNPTDVTGAYALSTQAQQAAYQAQMQNQSSNLGALAKLGGSLMMAPMTGGGSMIGNFVGSDVRLKTDIRRVGVLDNGVPIYSYRYKVGGPPQIGVMAQELAGVRPDAVAEIGGYLHVNYGAL